MDAAVRTAQQHREGPDSDRDSDASLESVSSAGDKGSISSSSDRGSSASEKGMQKSAGLDSKKEDKPKKKKKKRPSKSSSQKMKLVEERISQYREGKKNLPPYEIIQNSFHVKTGKVDLQLCDDMGDTGVTDTVQGTMLIEVCA